MSNNLYPDLSNQMKKREEQKIHDDFENIDDVEDDDSYYMNRNKGNNYNGNYQQSMNMGQQNNHQLQQLPIFDKNSLNQYFQPDPEMEGISVDIIEQTSKKDWLVVEHVLYSIKSSQRGKEQSFIVVQRRYSDFEWLLKEFDNRYIGIIFPPLPEKNALSKINLQSVDLIKRTEFFQERLIGLKAFLRKVLEHPKLSKTREFKSFIKDNDSEFQKFKEKSITNRQNMNEPMGSGVIKKIYNTVSTGITTAVDYISGTKQKREREKTQEDDKFDKLEQYYQSQQDKINETTTCLHNIFEFKRKQAENMEQISIILEQLKNQKGVTELKDTTSKASEQQTKNSKDLIYSIENPLKEQIKHFDSCLGILSHRKELQQRIFENQQKIEQFSRLAGKQEEVLNLRDEVENDERRLEILQYLFLEDSEYFNNMIQNQIKDIITSFSQKSITHSQMMSRIWQHSN